MSIFGGGALNVGGHKVSYGLLAAGAGIAGAVLLVIQLRRSGGAIAAGPTTAQGAGVTGSDYSGALANLSQQVGGLQGAITALTATGPPAPTPGPVTTPAPPIPPAPITTPPAGIPGIDLAQWVKDAVAAQTRAVPGSGSSGSTFGSAGDWAFWTALFSNNGADRTRQAVWNAYAPLIHGADSTYYASAYGLASSVAAPSFVGPPIRSDQGNQGQ